MTSTAGRPIRLGLRVNVAQFSLLVGVNALVGGMLGQERTVVPLLTTEVFGLPGYTAALTFIIAFGIAKAATNYIAGTLSDRFGRKPVLVAGWLVAVPVPMLLIWAPSWAWVVVANVLLGISQGLTWSTTVVMKIDLVGPARRGLAMGFNEAAGYTAVALTAMATGYVAADHGLRPAPFYLGIAFAALGLGVSTLFVHETREYARLESTNHVTRADGRHDHLGDDLSDGEVFRQTSFREPALSAASQAGLVNNLNDGLAWGLFPVLFLSAGLSIERIGLLAATYPMVWGLGQLVTGGLSDRWGRKWLIAAGMAVQAVGLSVMATTGGFAWWFVAAVILGAGTAMVYPTLLAAIGDVAHPAWRARAVGTYRLWRDGGFAVGALLAGILADLYGVRAAIGAVAALTALSGVIVAVRMYETRHDPARHHSAVKKRLRVSRREAKTALYEQFARAGKGLSNPKRLELLDLLAQGEYTVDALATAAGLGLSTASMHLQALKEAGLVRARRERTFMHYRLAGDDVAALLALLRTVATTHLAEAGRATAGYLGTSATDDSDAVARDELLRRVRTEHVIVLDVRPTTEYTAGHIPGAVSVPLSELEDRLDDLPTDIEIVAYCRGAYCVLAYDAVDRLTAAGRSARRLHQGMLEWRLAGLPVEQGIA